MIPSPAEIRAARADYLLAIQDDIYVRRAIQTAAIRHATN